MVLMDGIGLGLGFAKEIVGFFFGLSLLFFYTVAFFFISTLLPNASMYHKFM